MESVMEGGPLNIAYSDDSRTLHCHGDWVIGEISELNRLLHDVNVAGQSIKVIDVSGVLSVDTSGALMLLKLLDSCKDIVKECHLVGLSDDYRSLLELISKDKKVVSQVVVLNPHSHNDFYIIGKSVFRRFRQWSLILAFLGELIVTLFTELCNPLKLAWRSICENIDSAGFKALPIIGLMSFLIGIVLAYQLSGQLQEYGADIFVVDITAIGILREFGPLITAIVMAGRTSTSFAALIGTMKVNEELDALTTMGVTPMSNLVLPRIIAVLIIMPLLIVWSDILGIFGSMFISKSLLGISYISFLDRMHYEVSDMEYLLGIIKAPIFSFIIAGVGCLQGTLVESSADSVGKQTTKAAVQAIFMVIMADAGFSIIYSWIGV
ncbi:MAG: ABC transporter permease [Coxiellaceae bacterium]|nr:ABC transporter permease [Coxiellaceae bacterium]